MMSLESKPKKKVTTPRAVLPQVDAEAANRHLIAYFYAYYHNCDCDACKALRPVAEKIIKSMMKQSGGESASGGEA
jgi:phosphoribosylformimino-5-aminoimidazole carboxamide ribonucleotide (ProFAR) isomerase